MQTQSYSVLLPRLPGFPAPGSRRMNPPSTSNSRASTRPVEKPAKTKENHDLWMHVLHWSGRTNVKTESKLGRAGRVFVRLQPSQVKPGRAISTARRNSKHPGYCVSLAGAGRPPPRRKVSGTHVCIACHPLGKISFILRRPRLKTVGAPGVPRRASATACRSLTSKPGHPAPGNSRGSEKLFQGPEPKRQSLFASVETTRE